MRLFIGSLLVAAFSVKPIFGQDLPTRSLGFVAVSPCRLVDTRRGSGFTRPFGPPALAQKVARVFPIADHCAVPPSAKALSANIASTRSAGPGFISIWPDSAPQPSPLIASLNFATGQVTSNSVQAAMGAT